jgi:hypothetical protein
VVENGFASLLKAMEKDLGQLSLGLNVCESIIGEMVLERGKDLAFVDTDGSFWEIGFELTVKGRICFTLFREEDGFGRRGVSAFADAGDSALFGKLSQVPFQSSAGRHHTLRNRRD